MFRVFASALAAPGNIFRMHPSELMGLLEFAWSNRPAARSTVDGVLPGVVAVNLSPDAILIVAAIRAATAVGRRRLGGLLWQHLIYAYMIENTRITDIFRRIVFELVHGERLGTPLVAPPADAQQWLRTTEELFFRDPPPLSIFATFGHVRPDLRATRRNAYQRMFGMDLTHGTEDNKPYPYVKAEAANGSFVATFEEFLREVWVAMANLTNTSGVKSTDDAKIASLAQRLQEMLTSRRQGGNLSREEFAAISQMSWFHLTVETNTPIVQSLRAEAAGIEQRLFKIAERVGLPAHGLAKSYFEIAGPMSNLLTAIETGAYNLTANAFVLYTPGTAYPPPLTGGPEADLRTIVTHWMSITGRDVKATKVALVRAV